MTAIATGLFLGLTLLFVHLWTDGGTRSKDRSDSPLDEDDLPAPWAGHGSSVFSLTALFSAYLASALLFGMPALVGSALGSVAALLFIRQVIRKSEAKAGFNHFLSTRAFSIDKWDNLAGWALLALTQVGLAASELVFLREIGIQGFGFAEAHAEVVAISVGLIGYFYCLLGGYRAVFRTDIAQLLLVALMTIILIPFGSLWDTKVSLLGVRPDSTLWSFGFELPSVPRYCLHGLIGFAMGLGFLVSSPDCWKRVAVAEMPGIKRRFQFPLIVTAGLLPFLLLLPILMVAKPDASGALPQPLTLIFSSPLGSMVKVWVLVGMLSAFLSSFDSALLASTHVLETTKIAQRIRIRNVERYWILLGGSFLLVVATSVAATTISSNPFFLACFVVSGYAVSGGIYLGTWGLTRPVQHRGLGAAIAMILILWSIYVWENIEDLRVRPSEEGITLFAIGAVLMMSVAAVTWTTSRLRSVSPNNGR